MNELTELLREQVKLSKQILAELQKQSEWRLQGLDYKPLHAAEHLLTDKVVEQEAKERETKMRPIEDWLNELPEPIRSKALDSVDKDSELYKEVGGCVGSLWDTMFHINDDYNKTKEGACYWTDIEGQLEEGIPPSELVDPVHLDKSR